MKKHRLLEKAMFDYPNGTSVQWTVGNTTSVPFRLRMPYKASAINTVRDANGMLLFDGKRWATKIEQDLVSLIQMTQEHFIEVFDAEGFAPSFIQSTIAQFDSLWGFHNAISRYGEFGTYRKIADLGYDVEFKNK